MPLFSLREKICVTWLSLVHTGGFEVWKSCGCRHRVNFPVDFVFGSSDWEFIAYVKPLALSHVPDQYRRLV